MIRALRRASNNAIVPGVFWPPFLGLQGNIRRNDLMLVLTRKLGEGILIADSIIVSVVQVEKGKVRLGIEAPPEVRVLREELHKELESQIEN
jgi:carbon storage regulator